MLYSDNSQASKRLNFTSVQMSHVLPTNGYECLRIRTGYEKVVAVRTNDMYAYTAKDDGVVTDVDEELGMYTIRYKNGEVHTLSSKTQYGLCSELVTTQKQTMTVKLGDKFRKNDILRYNPEFFEPDFENTRQVCFKHGAIATVAIMDNSATFEDSSVITKDFGKRLVIEPVNIRMIELTSSTIVQEHKNIDDHVEMSDSLLVFEQDNTSDMSQLGFDEASLAYFEKLNRNAPKAKYTGKIVKVDCYFGCDLSEMHPSMAGMIRKFIKERNREANYAKDSKSNYDFLGVKPLPIGSKFKGITISKETVILQFYIQESIESGIGDKIVIDSSLKTVTSSVMDIAPRCVDSNRAVDVIFSATSISNRIVNSPIIEGIAETVLEKLEDDVLKMYFG